MIHEICKGSRVHRFHLGCCEKKQNDIGGNNFRSKQPFLVGEFEAVNFTYSTCLRNILLFTPFSAFVRQNIALGIVIPTP